MKRIKLSTNTKKSGFTLIELIVVVVIIGIISAIVLPQYSQYAKNARWTKINSNAEQIYRAILAAEAEIGDGTVETKPDIEKKLIERASQTLPGLVLSQRSQTSTLPNYSEDFFGVEYEIYDSNQPGTVVISLFIDDRYGTAGYAIWKDGEVTSRWGTLAE